MEQTGCTKQKRATMGPKPDLVAAGCLELVSLDEVEDVGAAQLEV